MTVKQAEEALEVAKQNEQSLSKAWSKASQRRMELEVFIKIALEGGQKEEPNEEESK